MITYYVALLDIGDKEVSRRVPLTPSGSARITVKTVTALMAVGLWEADKLVAIRAIPSHCTFGPGSHVDVEFSLCREQCHYKFADHTDIGGCLSEPAQTFVLTPPVLKYLVPLEPQRNPLVGAPMTDPNRAPLIIQAVRFHDTALLKALTSDLSLWDVLTCHRHSIEPHQLDWDDPRRRLMKHTAFGACYHAPIEKIALSAGCKVHEAAATLMWLTFNYPSFAAMHGEALVENLPEFLRNVKAVHNAHDKIRHDNEIDKMVEATLKRPSYYAQHPEALVTRVLALLELKESWSTRYPEDAGTAHVVDLVANRWNKYVSRHIAEAVKLWSLIDTAEKLEAFLAEEARR